LIIFQTSKHKTVIHAVNRKTCLFLCTCFFTAGPKLSFLFLRNKVPWKDNGQWSSHKLSPLTNWQYLRSILGLYVKVYEYNFLALNVKPPAEKLLLIVRPRLKNTLLLRGRFTIVYYLVKQDIMFYSIFRIQSFSTILQTKLT